MKSVNVLYISHIPTLLGANRSLLNLISGLGKRVSCVVLVPAEGDFSRELRARGIEYRIFKVPHSSVKIHTSLKQIIYHIPRLVTLKWRTTRLRRKLFDKLSLDTFDIIHSNSGVITFGLEMAKLLNKPHVWHLREFQDLDYNISFLGGKRKFLRLLEESTSVVAISQSIARHFLTRRPLQVVYNGIYEKFIEHQTPLAQTEEKYFLFCGALTMEKGIEDAILAFASISNKYQDVFLKVAGEFYDSDFKQRTHILIEQLGLQKKIIFLGFQSRTDELMARSIALLMCSHFEALGRVTIEAMFNYCLVIGKNSAGTSELISDGRTGLLYEDNEQLGSLLDRVLMNSVQMDHIKRTAFLFVNEHFTQERYANQIYGIYQEIINDPK